MPIMTGNKIAVLTQPRSPGVEETGIAWIYVSDNTLRVGDYFFLQDGQRYEFFQVTAGPTTISAAEYRYTVMRDLLGTGRQTFDKGTPVMYITKDQFEAYRSQGAVTPSGGGGGGFLDQAIQWAKNNPLYAAGIGVAVLLVLRRR